MAVYQDSEQFYSQIHTTESGGKEYIILSQLDELYF